MPSVCPGLWRKKSRWKSLLGHDCFNQLLTVDATLSNTEVVLGGSLKNKASRENGTANTEAVTGEHGRCVCTRAPSCGLDARISTLGYWRSGEYAWSWNQRTRIVRNWSAESQKGGVRQHGEQLQGVLPLMDMKRSFRKLMQNVCKICLLKPFHPIFHRVFWSALLDNLKYIFWHMAAFKNFKYVSVFLAAFLFSQAESMWF